MTSQSIVLVGGPDSGKTNYLGRLWATLNTGNGRLKPARPPGDIQYVEEILGHLLQGEFAPRSDPTLETRQTNFTVSLVLSDGNGTGEIELTVPDVLGELWQSAVEALDMPKHWLDKLKSSTGALLFVRVHSELNVAPLDWVTTERLLRAQGDTDDEKKLPTQVFLCELLRILEHTLAVTDSQERPRVAVVVTAWDLLDEDSKRMGPMNYLRQQYPLFAGRLSDIDTLNVRVFGVSVVGGDLNDDPDFRHTFSEGDLQDFGFVVTDSVDGIHEQRDITSPVAWLVTG
ncbi:hypothetical protein [Burkholderia cenocepacia]|uniref:Double-GTPase 1 domain-containing protein n=1 Tax=Burkholderia cenocepacia TaxID=95486 RepID=A0A427P4B7_9BURK|nr:hypothetical protein [Burkholderia cenocepacia]RSC14590.1 hypothetical protein EGT41_15400 [Burkholderia cenocepacia]